MKRAIRSEVLGRVASSVVKSLKQSFSLPREAPPLSWQVEPLQSRGICLRCGRLKAGWSEDRVPQKVSPPGQTQSDSCCALAENTKHMPRHSSPQLPRHIEAAFQEFHLALPVSENHSSSEFVTVFTHLDEDVVFQLCGTRCLEVPLLTNLMLWSLTDFFGLRLERFPIQSCGWVSTDFHGFRKDTALASLPLGPHHHPSLYACIRTAKLCHPVCQKLQVLWLQRCPHRLLDMRFSLIHDY